MSQGIERINPTALFDSTQNHHSQLSVVAAGRLAFCSGQVAWRPGGVQAPAALAEQAAIVVGHLRTCLDAVRADTQDIVMLRIYVVDLTPERVGEVMPHLRQFLGDAQPSITGIGVQALAGPDLQIEIEMVMQVPA